VTGGSLDRGVTEAYDTSYVTGNRYPVAWWVNGWATHLWAEHWQNIEIDATKLFDTQQISIQKFIVPNFQPELHVS